MNVRPNPHPQSHQPCTNCYRCKGTETPDAHGAHGVAPHNYFTTQAPPKAGSFRPKAGRSILFILVMPHPGPQAAGLAYHTGFQYERACHPPRRRQGGALRLVTAPAASRGLCG